MSNFTLYSGPHCSLCETAKKLIRPELEQAAQRLVVLDITTDVNLLRRYRVTIPVLANSDGRELHWPFDKEQLQVFLNE